MHSSQLLPCEPLERNRSAVGKSQSLGEPASALLCSCFASAVAYPDRPSCPRDQCIDLSKPCAAAPRLRSRACTRKAATVCGEAIVCACPSCTGLFLSVLDAGPVQVKSWSRTKPLCGGKDWDLADLPTPSTTQAIHPGSAPPLNQGDPPCQSPAWPPGPRQGWAAGSDRFRLRELRVSRHFSTFYGPSVQTMDTQLGARCQHFLSSLGPFLAA